MKPVLFLFCVFALCGGIIAALRGDLFSQLLMLTLAGTICHYLNGVFKGDISCDPMDYFTGAAKSTLASLGGCVLTVFSIIQSGHADSLDYLMAGAAFSAGYCSDSLLNKAPS